MRSIVKLAFLISTEIYFLHGIAGSKMLVVGQVLLVIQFLFTKLLEASQLRTKMGVGTLTLRWFFFPTLRSQAGAA